MSQLPSQLKRALAELQASESSLAKIWEFESENTASMVSFDLESLARRLAGAKSELSQIESKLEAIETLRSEGLKTDELLKAHADQGVDEFQNPEFGFFHYLGDLLGPQVEKLNAKSIPELIRLREHAKRAARLLFLMPRPKLSFALSWRFALLVCIVGTIVSLGAYCWYFATTRQPGVSQTQAINAAAAKGVAAVERASKDPEKTPLARTIEVTKAINTEIPGITKAVVSLTALLTALQRLLSGAAGPKSRKR